MILSTIVIIMTSLLTAIFRGLVKKKRRKDCVDNMSKKHYFTVNFDGDVFQSNIKNLTLPSLITEVRAMTNMGDETISEICYYTCNSSTKMIVQSDKDVENALKHYYPDGACVFRLNTEAVGLHQENKVNTSIPLIPLVAPLQLTLPVFGTTESSIILAHAPVTVDMGTQQAPHVSDTYQLEDNKNTMEEEENMIIYDYDNGGATSLSSNIVSPVSVRDQSLGPSNAAVDADDEQDTHDDGKLY